MNWGEFLIRRSSAIRRFFAGFVRCDSLTIMKSFLHKIAHEFSGSVVRFLCKFPVKSRAFFFLETTSLFTTIAPHKSCEKPAKRRAASDDKTHPRVTQGFNPGLLLLCIYFIISCHVTLLIFFYVR